MHPILEEFCDKWVWPTMPGAPGAEFRLKLTHEKCLAACETPSSAPFATSRRN